MNYLTRTIRVWGLLGIFLQLTLLHAAENPGKSAEEFVREGNSFVKQGRYQEAIRVYKKAYDHHKEPDAAYNLAIVYDRYLNFDRKAVVFYREFLRLMPEYSDSEQVQEWINQALSEQAQVKSDPLRHSSEAIKYILEDPQAGPHTKGGNQALEKHEYERAINEYRQAVVINNSSTACYNIALLYDLDLNFYTRAIYYYQKYLAMAPETKIAGVVAKRIKKARQALAKSMEVVPTFQLFPLRGPK